MPTYDYVCDACEHQFELFQSITEPPARKCPACGRKKLRRLIGPGAAIVFKGSGFYTTDYRSESYKKAAAAENSSAAAASGSTASGDGAGKQESASASSGDGSSKRGKKSAAAKPAAT